MAQKFAGTQGTSRRGLNTRSMDYQVTYQHSLRSAPEDFIAHVPSQMVCNVPTTVDQIIQRLCPSGVVPQSAFGGNRRCRRCAWLQGDAIFSTLRVRSGRRSAGSLNATQLIRLISIKVLQNNGPHGGDRVWRSRDGRRLLPPAPPLLRVWSRAVNTDHVRRIVTVSARGVSVSVASHHGRRN